MSQKKPLRRRLIRLSLWLAAAVTSAFGLQVGLLAFPQILLKDKAEAGSVVGNLTPGAPTPAKLPSSLPGPCQ